MTDFSQPLGSADLTAADASTFEFTSAAVAPEAAAAEAVAEAAEPNGFALLGLAPQLLAAVADLGFTQPTSVQQQCIGLAMNKGEGTQGAASYNDLMVSSQTGSGKTAAFLLPVLHTLLKQQAAAAEAEQKAFDEAVARGEKPARRPRQNPLNPRTFKAAVPGALILCPTRELAQQVANDAIDLVKHCRGLRIANVVGGMPYQMQIARLQNADLVVATPGRLLDLQRSSQIKLDQVQFLVVDEADRMLDLGFADDLAEVHQLTANRNQTMMFSATFAPRIQQLAQRVMRQPQRVQVDSPQEKHANIKQVLFWADDQRHKRALLDHWLRDASIDQAIVFASTQVECDGLAADLQQDGFDAVALHGALNQGLRNRRLMALRNGQVQILVATDVAARGIDVPTITHVFNYGLPMKSEDYTHRIGRTGRAGRDGLAVTFAEHRDRRKIGDIEHYTQQRIASETIPGLEPKARFDTRPARAGFGGKPGGRPAHGRTGGFGGGNGGGNGFGKHSGFGAKSFANGARDTRSPGGRDAGQREGGFGQRDAAFGAREGGFGQRDAGGFGAPRRDGGFGHRDNGGFGQRDNGFGAPRREGNFGGRGRPGR